jgi:hypothetical protein
MYVSLPPSLYCPTGEWQLACHYGMPVGGPGQMHMVPLQPFGWGTASPSSATVMLAVYIHNIIQFLHVNSSTRILRPFLYTSAVSLHTDSSLHIRLTAGATLFWHGPSSHAHSILLFRLISSFRCLPYFGSPPAACCYYRHATIIIFI